MELQYKKSINVTKQEKVARNRIRRQIYPDSLATKKAWRQAHPESVKVSRDAWRHAHKEQKVACDRAYRQGNRDKVRIVHRTWSRAHPEKIKAKDARRRKYGYNMLNVYFPGSVGHHVTDVDVVFIPEEVHVSCYVGSDKMLHRERVMRLYGNLSNMIDGILKEEY